MLAPAHAFLLLAVETPTPSSRQASSVRRYTLAIVLLIILSLSIWQAARAGFASLLYTYAEQSGQLAAADAAVNLNPNDPETHVARAAVLEVNGELAAAIAEYKQAVSLRPQDYVLWLSLARTYELNGDVPAAIAAARQAIPLAPYYAQPHWQLGNILVRAGQLEEGFAELRLAGASDPTLLPSVIDLAWQLSHGDAQFMNNAIAPQSREAYVALAEYFRKRGKVNEAIANYMAAGSEANEQRQQYLTELVSAKQFKEAYALWLIANPDNPKDGIGVVVNPGFEQESNLDGAGFGWRTSNRAPSILLALDPTNAQGGQSSLSVEFKGESDTASPVISQLVLVSPNAHYQLSFGARTESIVSGGLPRVSVIDSTSNQVLGVPVVLPQKTSGWQDFSIDFTSNDNTTAILISLQRRVVAIPHAPSSAIFGWIISPC